MTHRTEIRFLLNDQTVTLDRVGASDTLLDFLRLERRLTGTKEGCAEGDCGACTVLVGRLQDGAVRYEPVNACIRFLASLDGCHVVSVEYLSGPEGRLHPVQQAMVEHHGSQCGFCTPGFVMSLYALWMENPDPSETEIETALQGNLCRCTGYEPIIRAAKAATALGTPAEDALTRERDSVLRKLEALRDGRRVVISRGDSRCILPASVDDLAEVLVENPKATMVAGATDVGLWVTKFLRDISPVVLLSHLDGLRNLTVGAESIEIGAGVNYTDSRGALTADYPQLGAFWDRIAGWQIRNMGTIGGNVANGSPIGDTPPVLIALGATITLRRGSERRRLPIEDFFIDYGKQDLAEGEFLEAISVPRPTAGAIHAAYKISKRRDEDISSVCAAFNVNVTDGRITEARIAFGGMAATPKRAANAEAALVGAAWSEAALIAAADRLEDDFTPLTDWRASSEYRMQVSKNLFRRFWLESQDSDAARLSA
ncbi:xanthine dehydrogenase small subunit [Cribrihabitans marinus]|uniref:Xanthine dehydrogenase small subunit n=1 Tax=Cribrihabitans marinus TaxID=1227549 RepID=A0A1H7D6W6_9RHOB|nr:xanthine dehydrogenase small subunit [Cribrihabitans marinus]GGH37913.1 xanthine dehydrogenase small subunit [Cribrihabitans marinus]SEJ97569.1 xanthine dehydrogenase small subunit [Cribrihabitans marinus]